MTRREAQMMDAGIGRDQLIGMEVLDAQGDAVGRIDDVLLGPDGRRLDRVVVLTGGGLFGGKERLTLVPWNEVRIDTDEKRVQVPMTRDQIRQATTFRYAGSETRLSQQAARNDSGKTDAAAQEGERKP